MKRVTTESAAVSEQEHARLRRQLGQAIREYRRDMPQADLGTMLGDLPQTTISRWERGMVDLTAKQIRDLEAVLNLVPGTLLVAAGFVRTTQEVDPVIALKNDRTLDDETRESCIIAYRSFQDLAARRVNAGGSARRRTSPKTTKAAAK